MNFSLSAPAPGLVSALLIAVVAKATPLALCCSFAPIPSHRDLGWDHRAGLVACPPAALGDASPVAIEGIGFAVGTGLPAWWLGYLRLARQGAAERRDDWYPLGRLLPGSPRRPC